MKAISESSVPEIVTALFAALGVVFAVLVAIKQQLPHPKFKWKVQHFRVTCPPSKKMDKFRWYHRAVLENVGDRPANGPHRIITATKPILTYRLDPERKLWLVEAPKEGLILGPCSFPASSPLCRPQAQVTISQDDSWEN